MCDPTVLRRCPFLAAILCSGSLILFPSAGHGQTPSFLRVVRDYADAMIERGRDSYGPQASGLLLSALDRRTRSPLTTLPAAPSGVRGIDRVGDGQGPLTGANPHHDENLIRILYALSQFTNDPRYREAADQEIQWFFEHAAWSQTGLLAWGEHMSWEVMQDRPASRFVPPRHEFGRPWVLWDRSFELAPDACLRFARGLWAHQIADQETGAFDRHALPFKHGPETQYDFPRHGGFYIATWAAAYRQSKDAVFLRAIETLVSRFENKRHRQTGLINAWQDELIAWPQSELSLAIDCEASAAMLPEPLANRLRSFAAREDEVYLRLPHAPAEEGFVITALRETGQAIDDRSWQAYTTPWGMAYGEATTGMLALTCLARFVQTQNEAYRELIVEAARGYLRAAPPEEHDTWPMPYGHAISTLLAGYRLTLDGAYRERARELGVEAIRRFWSDGPLPRASLETEHYESITGADSLAVALLQLAWVDDPLGSSLLTNTIDR